MARSTTGTAGGGNAGLAARDQLLEAASDLMIERGSTEISLSEIAQRSGLNSALVKYYFGNKAGLLVAMLRRALGPAMEQLVHLETMAIPPIDKLRIHISGMVNSYFRYPYVNRLMHDMLAADGATFGPVIADEFVGPLAAAHRAILAEGTASGEFREIDPLLFYNAVVGACDQLFHGRFHLGRVFGVETVDESFKRRYADQLFALVTHGLVIGGGPEPGRPS